MMKEEMLFEIVKKEFNAKLTIRNGCINAEDWEKNVEWHGSVEKPSWDTLLIFKNKYDAEYASNKYQRDRQPNYPPMENYLDGIVKGDQAQVDKYIADCLAVKKRFPKRVH